MDPLLMHRAEIRGFVTRPDILDSGYTDRDIREAIHIGLLVRIGPGLYALTATFTPLSPQARLATRSRAVSHRLRDHVVLTHESAAVMHGIDVWGTNLDEVHVTRLDGGRGRHEAGVQHHVGRIADADIVEIDGVLVSSPDRCVWELACASSVESALVTADSALHQRLVSSESLTEKAGQFREWRGSRSGRLALSLSDARSESPGESRTRYLFWRHDVPKPELQVRVYDSSGRVIARTDFGWELWRHLAEFDGRIKYDGTFVPDGFETVFSEKRREDEIRGEQWGMSRIINADLPSAVAEKTARRIKADLERSRSLYARYIA